MYENNEFWDYMVLKISLNLFHTLTSLFVVKLTGVPQEAEGSEPVDPEEYLQPKSQRAPGPGTPESPGPQNQTNWDRELLQHQPSRYPSDSLQKGMFLPKHLISYVSSFINSYMKSKPFIVSTHIQFMTTSANFEITVVQYSLANPDLTGPDSVRIRECPD